MRFERIVALSLLSTAGSLVGTITPAVASAASNKLIIVGSKNISKSKTVSEIYALALEHEGYKATRKPNISNNVIFSAVQKGKVDAYPNYTGTIVEACLKKKGTGKNANQMAKLAYDDIQENGSMTFKHVLGDDYQGVVMPTKDAKKYRTVNLSEPQKNAKKTNFASQGESKKRVDILPEMNKVCGKFDFRSTKDYDVDLLYKIMEQGKAQAAPVSITDGQLATGKLALLKDNKNIWLPHNLAPVVNKRTAKSHSKMKQALSKVNTKLATKQLTDLNKKINIDRQNYRTVAKNWYNQNMK